jgi:hypothetical protein
VVKGLVKYETACTMVKLLTKYVDASPFEWLERRLLPSDSRILTRKPQAAESCKQACMPISAPTSPINALEK